MAFEKINHNTLSKQVVRAIRHQIFSGALKPNQRVVEAEIAQEMGISRGPVREAFAELEKEGLIVAYPRRGTFVKSFELKDIEEIYTLRALLEGFAVSLALDRLREQDLDYLRGLLDRITDMAEKKDVIEVSRLNLQFHEKIMELSAHKRLYDTWQSLLAQTQMLSAMTTEYYTSLIDIRKSHKILLEALMTGDRGHIKRSFEDHILRSMNELLDFLRKMKTEGTTEEPGGEAFPDKGAAEKPLAEAAERKGADLSTGGDENAAGGF